MSRPSSLAEATRAYQAYLEVNRTVLETACDTELIEQVAADLAKARAAMEVAWLEAAVAP